jgi:hypothetical protein
MKESNFLLLFCVFDYEMKLYKYAFNHFVSVDNKENVYTFSYVYIRRADSSRLFFFAFQLSKHNEKKRKEEEFLGFSSCMVFI